jgi:hypothetical protein
MGCIIPSANVSSSPYSVQYRPATSQSFDTLGSVSADGIVERIVKGGETIQTNALGAATAVTSIYTGQTRFLDMTLQEYRLPMVQRLLYDYTEGLAVIDDANRQFALGSVGRHACQYAGALRLVPIFADAPGRHPQTGNATPNIEYYSVALSSDQEVSLAMKAGLMTIPVVVQLFPVLVNPGNPSVRHYTYGRYF